MCGIAGVLEFDPHAPADGALIERMTTLLAHRGPDDAGHMVSGPVALGHRRLSIIDLSPAGHQPMSNDDRSIWITYNGECYNYVELADRLRSRGVRFRSSSDTEVLIRLYEQEGDAFLEQVEGMFALALWNRRERTLLLARDRLGVKPLYYFRDARRFAFASEMKALLAVPDVSSQIDMGAMSEYLHLLSIPGEQSIFRGIRKMPPGHFMKIGPTGVKQTRYWDVTVAPDPDMTMEEATSGFDRLFGAAVGSHMVADVPVGAFLSGGVDSSSVVAAATRFSSYPIESFAVGFPGTEGFDEGPFAERVAAHCGTRHRQFDLKPDLIGTLPRIAWHADEPFAVSSAFALFSLAELARRHVKVVLSGDGGDEVFAGYVWRHQDCPDRSRFYANPLLRAVAGALNTEPIRRWLPAGLRSRLHRFAPNDERYVQSFTAFPDPELAWLLEPDYAAEVSRAWSANVTQRCYDAAPAGEQLARKLYTDIKTTLVSEMLTKVDRMTMAHGLEARVPFLDHRLVEWAFTVPGRLKLRAGEGKLLVKKAMEKSLPVEILYRAKQGFNVPLKLWMRDELREFVRDNLCESRIRRRGIFRPAGVDRLLQEHFSGATDASNRIFMMLMLELWQQRFVDERMQQPST